MRHLLWIVMGLLLFGCTTTREASSGYRTTERMDSVFITTTQRDSIYLHDSIYMLEKGDTVYKYVERLRYKYVSTTDTVMRTKIDTSFVERVELREVEQQVEWYNKCFMRLGQLVCAAIILCVLYYFLNKRLL